MKYNILNILTVCGALSLGLTSCHDNPDMPAEPDNEFGEVSLASLSVDMSHAEKVVTSNAGRATVDLNDFIVTIEDKNGITPSQTWRYGDMPEILTLPVGDSYVVKVKSHDIKKAEWEKPYYEGETTFAIQKDDITQIGVVTAKFSSLKVTVVFGDDLRKVMGDDVTVTVKANDSGELVYTPSETRAGYFEVVPGSTTMTAHFEGTVDGVKTVQDTPFSDVDIAQHRIITYKLKSNPEIPDQSGQIDPSDGIGVDAEVTTVPIDSNIIVDEDLLDGSDRPGQEERPEEPDPGPGPDNPDEERVATFEATDSPNLDLNGVNIASDTFGNAKVTITCPKGIKHLVVDIQTDSDGFISTLNDLNLKNFDLAYPGDAEESLESLQLPIKDQVINQTEVLFDITNFVGLLCIYPGNHNFVISVTNNENEVETMTLRFKAN